MLRLILFLLLLFVVIVCLSRLLYQAMFSLVPSFQYGVLKENPNSSEKVLSPRQLILSPMWVPSIILISLLGYLQYGLPTVSETEFYTEYTYTASKDKNTGFYSSGSTKFLSVSSHTNVEITFKDVTLEGRASEFPVVRGSDKQGLEVTQVTADMPNVSDIALFVYGEEFLKGYTQYKDVKIYE